MKRILPVLLGISLFLTPLYPIYAQNTATNPAKLRPEKAMDKKDSMMERAQDKIVSTRDKMASREAELKKKLARFKDKIKAGRVENISNNLNQINQRRTSHMQDVLEKISKIIESLKGKTEQAAASGKDVSAISKAIAVVETKWAETDASLKAQMEKDYSIAVNKESTVKQDAASARESLRTDLKAAHTQVVETRKALAGAIQIASSSMKGGNNESE